MGTTTRNALTKLVAGVSTRKNLISYFNSNADIVDAALAKANFNASSNPGTGDDSADGYSAGSIWFNTTAHKKFICINASVGAAVWRQIWPALAADMNLTLYALLGGRSGGQTIYGGTAASETLTLKSTSHATKGKIRIGSLSAYDEVNGRLGIGVTDPDANAEISNSVYITRSTDNTYGASLALRKNRGSRSSPTAVQSADEVGSVVAQGYGTSGYLASGQIMFKAAEDFSTTCGTHIIFNVAAVGASSVTERMRLFASGGLALGSTSDPGAGNFYASGNISGASFTDRTKAFIGDALIAIERIRALANGELDHTSLPEFAADCYCDEMGEWWPGRSIGDMVSVLVAWAQQFREKMEKDIAERDERINRLEARLIAIEARLNA